MGGEEEYFAVSSQEIHLLIYAEIFAQDGNFKWQAPLTKSNVGPSANIEAPFTTLPLPPRGNTPSPLCTPIPRFLGSSVESPKDTFKGQMVALLVALILVSIVPLIMGESLGITGDLESKGAKEHADNGSIHFDDRPDHQVHVILCHCG